MCILPNVESAAARIGLGPGGSSAVARGQKWEVGTWENTLCKLPLGKMPLGKYLTS